MNAGSQFLDCAIFIGYAIMIPGMDLWVSGDKKEKQKMRKTTF